MRCNVRWFGLVMVVVASNAGAQSSPEVQATGCGPDDVTVHVGNMGMVSQEHLQAHMDRMQDKLSRARRMEPRSSQHRKLLEQHMEDMESGMEKLQAACGTQACESGATTTLESRVQTLEQRLGAMQGMLDQVIKHVRESERGR